jgi:hypothetical protein
MNRLNKIGATELRKALATTGSGQYLIEEDLEPLIRDYLWFLSPLTERIPLVQATGKIHEVVRRTAVNRGWFEGESTDPNYSQSTYDRRQVIIKILRTSGKVTDFQQSASRSFVDAVAEEIDAATMALADVFEFAAIYGMSTDMTTYDITGDAYQNTGLYGWLMEDGLTNHVRDANSNGAAGATVSLSLLDEMYATTVGKYRNFARDPYMWLMSQSMIDKVSGLQTRITRESQSIEFEGGFVMNTYKGIPMLPSHFCAPESATASPTSLAATATVGGSLDDDTYYYRVAAITLYGEQVAAAEVNATTAGTQSTVTLSWTADSDAKLYAIYRGTATGDNNLGLLDIIPAKTYTAAGAVSANVASYEDDGTITSTAAVQPLDAGEEVIWLVNLGVNYGLSRPVLTPSLGSPVDSLVNYIEIPVATDEHAFRLKHFGSIQVPRGESSCVLRRAKTS